MNGKCVCLRLCLAYCVRGEGMIEKGGSETLLQKAGQGLRKPMDMVICHLADASFPN